MSAMSIDAMQGEGADKRGAPRVRTLKRAKVMFNNRYSTFDCVVRNISTTGALLTLDEAAHLPKEFEVEIGEDKVFHPAKLVYRRGVFAGIRFLDVPAEDGAAPEPHPVASKQVPAHHAAVPASAVSIRRLVPDDLPLALRRNFRWS